MVRCTRSTFNEALKDSASALSKHDPVRPTDRRTLSAAAASANDRLEYWVPRMLSCLSTDRFGSGGAPAGTAGLPPASRPLPLTRSPWRASLDPGSLTGLGQGVAGRLGACPPGARAPTLACRGGGVEQVVDLAGEVALEAADDLEFGVAFGGLAGEVGLGAFVDA